jgi:hypothetical protein
MIARFGDGPPRCSICQFLNLQAMYENRKSKRISLVGPKGRVGGVAELRKKPAQSLQKLAARNLRPIGPSLGVEQHWTTHYTRFKRAKISLGFMSHRRKISLFTIP